MTKLLLPRPEKTPMPLTRTMRKIHNYPKFLSLINQRNRFEVVSPKRILLKQPLSKMKIIISISLTTLLYASSLVAEVKVDRAKLGMFQPIIDVAHN